MVVAVATIEMMALSLKGPLGPKREARFNEHPSMVEALEPPARDLLEVLPYM